MALDDTDRRLLKGLIWLTVFAGLAYIFPGFWLFPGGYRTQKQEEAQSYEKLTKEAELYRKYYKEIGPAYFGLNQVDPIADPPGMAMTELKAQFVKTNAETQQLIEEKEKASKMSFPEWAKVPEEFTRDPGVWFKKMWERKKNTLSTELNGAKMDCDDPDIGFGRFTGEIGSWDVNKTEEYLRELCIAERIIQLCILAKQHQEQFERGNGFEPEAFMRIMVVTPRESSTSGPSALIPNPKYNPDEKNPTSERFRKYRVKYWKSFIQDYPVQILLECDVNSYMRFLHSVRQEGQFLVIRTLQIVSPFLKDSPYDKSELNAADLPKDPNDPDKKVEFQADHILVRMSAAGMDFFDPAKNPTGLYSVKATKDLKNAVGGRRGRVIPAPPPAP